MSPSLDIQLCEKYPKIFKNRNDDSKNSRISFGIECGDGWYNILDMLCMAASSIYNTAIKIDKEDAVKYGIESPDDEAGERYYFTVEAPQFVADQVKEKFGTLRFYYHLEFDHRTSELLETKKYPELQKIVDNFYVYFDAMVHMAGVMSAHICEMTGREGEMHISNGGKNGWYKTLNCEYAKAEEFYVDRNYVPVSMVAKDEEL